MSEVTYALIELWVSVVEGSSERDRDGECVPDSWSGVEDDGRTRRQMAHSSAGRSTPSLWLKDKKRRAGGTRSLNLNMTNNS